VPDPSDCSDEESRAFLGGVQAITDRIAKSRVLGDLFEVCLFPDDGLRFLLASAQCSAKCLAQCLAQCLARCSGMVLGMALGMGAPQAAERISASFIG
jgi:hypothetical protein